MAEDKKSFLMYCDLIHVIEKMPDDKAGLLLKHLLRYVNDLNPTTDDLIVDLAFEPIKQQLKRDLNKYNEKKAEKSESGRLGNLKRWNPDLYSQVILEKITLDEAEKIAKVRKKSQPDVLPSQTVANIAVNDTVTVTDNVNDTVSVISKVDSSVEVSKTSPPKQTKKTIEERKRIFYDKVAEFRNDYSKEMLRDFFDYWTEHGDDDHKMKFEKQKTFGMSLRLKNWNKNDKTFNNGKSNTTTQTADEKLNARIEANRLRLQEKFGITQQSS